MITFDEMNMRRLEGRNSTVFASNGWCVTEPDAEASSFIRHLPANLCAAKLFRLARLTHMAAKKYCNPPTLFIGGHVVKSGCGPLIVDLMRRGYVAAIGMPGSAAIHDIEMTLVGHTSEDVASGVTDGSYGVTDDTGRIFAEAAETAALDGSVTLGASLGLLVRAQNVNAFSGYSGVLAMASVLGIPATVHVAIGTDTTHIHPRCDGAALGAASYFDFRAFTTAISKTELHINIGSAVIGPEVFLKAVTACRNMKVGRVGKGEFLNTANFDMLQQYRPTENVLRRPAVGDSFDIRGPHEIMLPLFHLMLSSIEAKHL